LGCSSGYMSPSSAYAYGVRKCSDCMRGLLRDDLSRTTLTK
jgi:hypothetical protein